MPETLTAVAAVAAAVISLANLLITTVVAGRREQTQWARDALTDAFVAFLDASWRGTDVLGAIAPRGAVVTVAQPAAADGEAAARDRALQSYEEMRTQLTRIRLLSSTRVLSAGEELLRRQRAAADAGNETLVRALERVSEARQMVVAAGKAEMGLSER